MWFIVIVVHMPQFIMSVSVFLQPVEQHVSPAEQVVPQLLQCAALFATQPPAQQSCELVQAVPQLPQCAASLFTQVPAQHSWPTAHAGAPQPPQCIGSLIVSMQLVPQHVCPVSEQSVGQPVHAGAVGA